MYNAKRYSILIVSSSQKADEYLRDIFCSSQFSPVTSAKSASEAARYTVQNQYDVVIINTPLNDEFGIDLAEGIVENSSSSVLLFVKNELFDQVSCKVENSGVLTFAKPGNKQSIFQAVKLMIATHNRLVEYEKKAIKLEVKMKEIRLVNRAKWLLIDKKNMNEEEAHKYIEKTAMDLCLKRSQIAENIIRTYEI